MSDGVRSSATAVSNNLLAIVLKFIRIGLIDWCKVSEINVEWKMKNEELLVRTEELWVMSQYLGSEYGKDLWFVRYSVQP